MADVIAHCRVDRCSPPRALRGFTLIELMIVVIVVAILASVAYPSYTEYVAKARRTQALAALAQGQQWLERFYSENFSYYQVRGSSQTVDGLFPAQLKQAPPAGEGSAYYQITLSVDAKTPEAYALRAVRAGAMAADRCGDYQVDQYGRKTLENYDTTRFATVQAAMAYCWR